MDIKKKLQNFDKKWGIIGNVSYEEEFQKFKNRVLNILLDIDSDVYEQDITKFCQTLGIIEKWNKNAFSGYKRSDNIINALIEENEEKRFYRLLQMISFLSIIKKTDTAGRVIYSRAILFNRLAEAIDLSKVNLSMVVKNDEIIFYPKGEEKLDEVLIDEVLSFLNPKGHKHFIDALNLYLNFSLENAIKSAESLRRSLEEFLRYKLNNPFGLNKNIKELGKKLKKDNRDTMVRNIILKTFLLLDQYFNENSKHQDGDIDEAENEFLVYQTGLLMRYIDKNIK